MLQLLGLKVAHVFQHRNQLGERIDIDGCSSGPVKSSNIGHRWENPRGSEVFWSLSTSAPTHPLNVGSEKGVSTGQKEEDSESSRLTESVNHQEREENLREET